MKIKKRLFNVEFFPICELKTNQQKLVSLPISMKSFFKYVSGRNAKDRFLLINGEKIRLQNVSKLTTDELSAYDNLVNCNNLWLLLFIKFKDSEIFGLANDNGDYDEDELERLLNSHDTDKHLASPTPCIYDEDKNILIIPRNKEGVSSSTILEFIRKVCKNKNLDFGYISNTQELDFSSNITIRNLELSIKNLTVMSQNTENKLLKAAPSVFSVISAFKQTGCDTANLGATMGDKRNCGLTLQTAQDMLALSRSECDNISRLKLGVLTSRGNKVNKIDLLHDKLIDQFIVYYSSKNRIKSDVILSKLLSSYNAKYSQIYVRG